MNPDTQPPIKGEDEIRRRIVQATKKLVNHHGLTGSVYQHADSQTIDDLLRLIKSYGDQRGLEGRIDELRAIYGWSHDDKDPVIFYPEHRTTDFDQMAANGMGTHLTVKERVKELEIELKAKQQEGK